MDEMTVQQAGALIAALYKQATGQAIPAPLDLSGYISVATTAIRTGYDTLMNAISQLWGRTVFAVRPYTGSFTDMAFTAERWGNATRKISYASRIPGTNGAYEYPIAYDAAYTDNPLGNGESVDMYKINKDVVVQTVFYDKCTYSYTRTRSLKQLETAFRGPEELVAYNAGAVQSLNNDREGWAESTRRGLLINGIGALKATEANEGRVIHLLTEYNAFTGLTLTATTVRQPENYAPFMRWVYGRIGEIRDRMREINTLYTTQFASLEARGYCILRHTPDANLRLKITSTELHHLRASVLSTTYNADYLSLDGVEPVAYWQSPEAPAQITVKPCYMADTGAVVRSGNAVTVSNIFGVMYDEDWVGCTNISSDMYVTPFNTRGKYWNDTYDEEWRTRFDMTEKAVVFCID